MGRHMDLKRRGRSVFGRAAAAAVSGGVLAVSGLAGVAPAGAAEAQAPQAGPAVRVLAFDGGAGAAVGDGTAAAAAAAVRGLGQAHGFAVDVTGDPGAFTPTTLAAYRAVVFLSGRDADVLDAEQEDALRGYVRAGGGFVGLGAAALAQPGSDWFTGLVGARPTTSPDGVQRAVVEVGDRVHPATRDLPLEWTRSDRWFNWTPNPSGTVHTVASVRETSYAPGAGANGPYHPISWCRDYDGGRSFYTGMGRTAAGFAESDLRAHLLGAIEWASGMVRGDCQATITSNYRATRLTRPNQPGQLDQIGEPHGLTVAPDGRVIYIGRAGREAGAPVVTDWNDPDVGRGFGTVHVWDPRTGQVTLAGILDVFGNRGGGDELNKTEEGLVGITLDPHFERNGWIYVYYMPHRSIDRVRQIGQRTISRFTLDLVTNTLDLSSEKVLLHWDAQIHSCCHVGGGMAFDRAGNLYVSTGDNNSSLGSDGYSGNNPQQDFMGVSFQDARRTAGNTNNLNGKILRLHPEPDGTYTIPEGNLFTGREAGGGRTRPEIYVMGVRNPTRLAVDPVTNWLLAGWVGPDASMPSTTWGPAKYETAAVIAEAGNGGWPYCMGNKQPYRDRNLPDPTVPLGWYDCDHLRNTSPRNDGLVDIPPARANNIWYSPQGGGPVFDRGPDGVPVYDLAHQTLTMPFLPGGGGQAIMPGPMYRFDAHSTSPVKWPRYWDGKWFLGDESRRDMRVAVTMDPRTAPHGGAPTHADDLRGIVPTSGINTLMDWKFGPDGALYVLNYGNGFFNLTANSALWRITYHGGPATPVPTASATVTGQGTPTRFAFSAGTSGGVSYRWDFGDGSTSNEADPVHTYTAGGTYTATLTVRYADGERATTTARVEVTCPAPDARPTVRILDTDTGVPNRSVGNGCTVNDVVDDEGRWASAGAFQEFMQDVTGALRRQGVLDGAEVGRIADAAAHSGVGTVDGYRSLFDGTAASLADWVQAPGGSFALQPDGSIRTVGGLGMLWYAGREFGDFSLRLQFRDARTDGGSSNSGVFVRFPDPRTPLAERPAGSCGTVGAARTEPAWVAIFCGQEVQIYDGTTGEPQKTGSIYNFAPLDLAHARPVPTGQWNDYEIRVVGQHYTVIRNGVVINEFDNTPGKTSSRAGDPPTDLRQFLSGFVGLQNHTASDVTDFRNVRIRELS